jgi:hypothetical protein
MRSDPRTVAVILKPLIDLHGEPKNWATAAPIYLQALRDIPPYLLVKAVAEMIATNQYFPKPAELRAVIADELYDRRRAADDELRRSSLPAPEPTPPPTDQEIAEVERLVGTLAKNIRRVPRQTGDGHSTVVLNAPAPEPLAPPDDPRVTKMLAEMGE